MAENPTMAFLQQALSVSGANAPMEETALFNQFMQRLVTSGFTIDTGGNISAPFVITGVVNVSAATGTLAVAHGGTGAVTLTGLVVGNGTSAMTTVTAPSGTIVGTSDSQVLSNKTINGSGNTLTVRAANDITGVLPTANGGTGIAFFTAAGPSAARVYTFPDAATTVLTTNAAVTVPQGGTGVATVAAHGVVVGAGTSPVAVTTPGTTGQVLTSNGASADPTFQTLPSGVIDRQVTLQTVANTVTETAVYTFAVPGGTLSTNKTLRLSLEGDHIINAGSADSVAVKVKYGATTIFSATVAAVNNGANRGNLQLDVELTAANATGAQRSKGVMFVGDSSQNNAGGVATDLVSLNSYVKYGGHVAIAEDSTASKNLVVTFQMGTANASIDMRAHTVYTELK